MGNTFPQIKVFENNTPGYSYVYFKDKEKPIFFVNKGISRISNGKKISNSTNFRLALITKMFTAYVVFKLIDKKDLSLEDKIVKYLPWINNRYKCISVKQLLAHRSGIPDHESILNKLEPRQFNNQDVYNLLKQDYDLEFEPGSNFSYSETGYVLLTKIIEVVTGKRYQKNIKNIIFDSFGMNNSEVLLNNDIQLANRAYGNIIKDGEFQEYDNHKFNNIIGNDGIYSNTKDLYRFYSKMFLTEDFKKLSKPFYGSNYGYGWFKKKINKRNIVFHDGFWVGFNSVVLRDIDTRENVIYLSNLDIIVGELNKVELAMKLIEENSN